MRWSVPVVALLGLMGSARALVVAPPPLPERVAAADCIVVGKITALEPKLVKAKQYPNSPQEIEYTVAIIQVEKGLLGAKGLTHVRLGFVPPPPPPPANAPVIGGGRNRFPQLKHQVGQEALFYLTKHHDQNFLVAPAYYNVVAKGPNLENEVESIRQAAKLLENPLPSLKSANATERLETAAMLLARYRNVQPGAKAGKLELVPAEESRLILEAIRGSDWAAGANPSPIAIFQRLGLTAADGWNPPKFKNFQKEFPPLAQKWLKDHAATYRIKRFVN